MSLASVVYLLGSLTLALAEGPAVPGGSVPAGTPAAGQPQQPGIGGMLVPFLAMFAVIYFLMIRPQQKKMREQQDMLASLKHGDEVITASGLLGKVTGIADKVITLEVADNVRVKMLKSQVTQIVKG
ncbi:MAG: preprotein translocase subunit YajC, partial [Oligoflexia bacterium]|nr:preprotein translocase subunit YajC [Oligoflexia bacterium]